MSSDTIAQNKQEVVERIQMFLENRINKDALSQTIEQLKVMSKVDHQAKQAYHLLRSGRYELAAAALKNPTSERTGRPTKD
jgi:hypothetical protein